MSDFPFDDRFYGIQNGDDAYLNSVCVGSQTIADNIGDMKCIRAVTGVIKGDSPTLVLEDGDGDSSVIIRENMKLSAQDYSFHTTAAPSGTPKMTFTNSGRLGIGTTTPACKLDINGTTIGSISVSSAGGREVVFDKQATQFFGTLNGMYVAINTSNGGAIVSWALYVGHSIQFSSDGRIKTDVKELDDNEALETFRKLKPCKYKYKEPIISDRTTNEVYGYIAQEVADVLPHAVTKADIEDTHQGHIPNMMSLCDISMNVNGETIVSIEKSLDTTKVSEIGGYEVSDASNNIPLKNITHLEMNEDEKHHPLIFYDKNKNLYKCNITEIIDETTFIVDNLSVEKENLIDGNKILLYGQKPNDFHRLNKDVIYTLSAAALQQVDRIQQQQQKKIEELEARILALENK